ELRTALETKQRIFLAACLREQVRGLGVLLHGFVVAVLLLLQEGVARDAFGRLRRSSAAQKTVVNRQGLALIARLDEHVEQQSVVLGGTIRLIRARVQIP